MLASGATQRGWVCSAPGQPCSWLLTCDAVSAAGDALHAFELILALNKLNFGWGDMCWFDLRLALPKRPTLLARRSRLQQVAPAAQGAVHWF